MNKIRKELEAEASSLEIEALKTNNKVNASDSEIATIKKLVWWLVWIGAGIMCIAFFPFYLMDVTYQKFNLYGDFIGGAVASIWALAGILFIYVAFLGQKQQSHMQRLDLKYSHYEMKSTRLELSEQKEQMEFQNETLKIQSFENTFFLLLQSQNEIIKLIDYRDKQNKVISTGRDCFRTFYKKLENLSFDRANIKLVLKNYSDVYEDLEGDLGHYFRHLYHILRFIDESKQIENKFKYTRLVRAQLSTYELAFLLYNCLSENGEEKFKPLIEKYAMLKNVSWKPILSKRHLLEYSSTAFGKKIENTHQNVSIKLLSKGEESSWTIGIEKRNSWIKVSAQNTSEEDTLIVSEEDFSSEFINALRRIINPFLDRSPAIPPADIPLIIEYTYRIVAILQQDIIYITFPHDQTDWDLTSYLNTIYQNSESSKEYPEQG